MSEEIQSRIVSEKIESLDSNNRKDFQKVLSKLDNLGTRDERLVNELSESLNSSLKSLRGSINSPFKSLNDSINSLGNNLLSPFTSISKGFSQIGDNIQKKIGSFFKPKPTGFSPKQFESLTLSFNSINKSIYNLTDVIQNEFSQNFREISKSIDNLSIVIVGNRLQEKENRAEMLRMLKDRGSDIGGGVLSSQGAGGGGGGGFLSSVSGQVVANFIPAGAILEGFKNLRKSISNNIKGIFSKGSLKALVSGFIGMLTQVTSGLVSILRGGAGAGKIIAGLKSFFASPTNPIGIAITVIVGLFSFISGFFKQWRKGKGEGLIKRLGKSIIAGLGAAIKNLIFVPLDILKSIVGFVLGMFGLDMAKKALASFSFADIFQKFIDGFIKMFGFLADLLNPIFIILDTAINMIMAPIKGVIKMIDGFISIIIEAFKLIVGIFTLDKKMIFGALKGIWNGIKRMLSGVFQMIYGAFIELFKGLWVFFNDKVIKFILNAITFVPRMISKAIFGALKMIFNFHKMVAKFVLKAIMFPFEMIKNLFSKNESSTEGGFFSKIGKFIFKLVTFPYRFLFNMIGKVFDFLKGIFEKFNLKEILTKIASFIFKVVFFPQIMIFKFIKSIFNFLTTKFKSVGKIASIIADAVMSVPKKIINFILGIIDAIPFVNPKKIPGLKKLAAWSGYKSEGSEEKEEGGKGSKDSGGSEKDEEKEKEKERKQKEKEEKKKRQEEEKEKKRQEKEEAKAEAKAKQEEFLRKMFGIKENSKEEEKQDKEQDKKEEEQKKDDSFERQVLGETKDGVKIVGDYYNDEVEELRVKAAEDWEKVQKANYNLLKFQSKAGEKSVIGKDELGEDIIGYADPEKQSQYQQLFYELNSASMESDKSRDVFAAAKLGKRTDKKIDSSIKMLRMMNFGKSLGLPEVQTDESGRITNVKEVDAAFESMVDFEISKGTDNKLEESVALPPQIENNDDIKSEILKPEQKRMSREEIWKRHLENVEAKREKRKAAIKKIGSFFGFGKKDEEEETAPVEELVEKEATIQDSQSQTNDDDNDDNWYEEELREQAQEAKKLLDLRQSELEDFQSKAGEMSVIGKDGLDEDIMGYADPEKQKEFRKLETERNYAAIDFRKAKREYADEKLGITVMEKNESKLETKIKRRNALLKNADKLGLTVQKDESGRITNLGEVDTAFENMIDSEILKVSEKDSSLETTPKIENNNDVIEQKRMSGEEIISRYQQTMNERREKRKAAIKKIGSFFGFGKKDEEDTPPVEELVEKEATIQDSVSDSKYDDYLAELYREDAQEAKKSFDLAQSELEDFQSKAGEMSVIGKDELDEDIMGYADPEKQKEFERLQSEKTYASIEFRKAKREYADAKLGVNADVAGAHRHPERIEKIRRDALIERADELGLSYAKPQLDEDGKIISGSNEALEHLYDKQIEEDLEYSSTTPEIVPETPSQQETIPVPENKKRPFKEVVKSFFGFGKKDEEEQDIDSSQTEKLLSEDEPKTSSPWDRTYKDLIEEIQQRKQAGEPVSDFREDPSSFSRVQKVSEEMKEAGVGKVAIKMKAPAIAALRWLDEQKQIQAAPGGFRQYTASQIFGGEKISDVIGVDVSSFGPKTSNSGQLLQQTQSEIQNQKMNQQSSTNNRQETKINNLSQRTSNFQNVSYVNNNLPDRTTESLQPKY
jgi:phage-related protein